MNPFIPASPASLSCFYALGILNILLMAWVVRRAGIPLKVFFIPYSALLVLFGIWVQSGIMIDQPMPAIPLTFLVLNALGIIVAFSFLGKRIAEVPLAFLIGLQGIRFPLEFILHSWAEQGTIPGVMTWTGQNWDIVTGLVSLGLFKFVDRSRPLAWTANLIGFLLLLNVLRVVVMSSPFPFAWELQDPLRLILYNPYALIVLVFVVPAMVLHLVAFRKLLSK